MGLLYSNGDLLQVRILTRQFLMSCVKSGSKLTNHYPISAVLMLEHPWLPSANIGEMSLDNGAATLAPISREAAAALQGAFDMISYFFIENNGWTCYRTSPFISHFLYLAASMHSRYSYLNLSGPANKLGALKRSLVLVNERWLAAGR